MYLFNPRTGRNEHVPSTYELNGSPRNCDHAFCRHPLIEAYRYGTRYYCSPACLEADTGDARERRWMTFLGSP